MESSAETQWELLSVVDNKQRGSQTRMMERLHFAQLSQQSTGGSELTRIERQQLEREMDRAREEKMVMQRERDRAREEKREMERERERERERVRRSEGERERERKEKSEMEAEVRELNREREQTKVNERAMEERTRQAEEGMKVFQEERDRAMVEKMQIVQHAEALSREAQNKIMELVAEKEKAEQKRNEIQLELDVLRIEKEGEQERTRKGREKAAIEAQRAEQEIAMLRQRAIKVEAQKEEYKHSLHVERSNFEHTVSHLEKERDYVRIEVREVERAKETYRQKNIKAEAEIGILRRRIDEQATIFERERDRARNETHKENEKLKLEFQKRLIELRKEYDKTRKEKHKAESERDKERLRRQEVEGRLRELERERDHQKSVVESVQHTELETGIGVEFEASKKATDTEILHTEQQLKQRLHEQVTESEEKVKILEEERIEVGSREIAMKADVVKETKGELEEDRERMGRERERMEKERMRVELQQAQARANQLQQRLDEVEMREHKKSVRQEQDKEQGSLKEDKLKRREPQVIAKRTVDVRNRQQDIIWEGHGLRLHIPPNSLPEDCPQLTIHMTVSRANDYKLPAEEGILVSAVYSFSHDLGDRKLRQPVTLQIQHCVASGSFTPLCIVQSDEISPPYQFHILEGGKFDGSDGYACIEVDHFCSFGVYLRWFFSSLVWNIKPCAVLYYTNIKTHSFHFHLYIVPHLDAVLKV